MGEINWYRYEEEAAREGFRCVCGIDEAGRGPLAGPVFAACVVLRPGEEIEGLNDSKKLSEKKRELLFAEITARAVDYSIAMATEQEIDEINILQATFLAMRRAFGGLHGKPARRAFRLPSAQSSRAMPNPHPSRRHRSLQRSAVTATCMSWTGSTRNTSLRSIRVMARSCTMSCSRSTGFPQCTGKPF